MNPRLHVVLLVLVVLVTAPLSWAWPFSAWNTKAFEKL